MIEITDRWVIPLLVLLADWSVRWGLVLAALALWLALRPPRLAGTRHTLCLVALAAGVLLPAVPRWGSLPISWPSPMRSIAITAPADTKVLPAALRSEPIDPNPPELPLVRQSGTMSGLASPLKSAIVEPSFADRIKAAGAWRIGAWFIAGSWMLMVTMLAARMIGGRRLLAKLREEAVAVDPASQELLADCRAALGLTRRLNLAMHAGVASPVTLGGFRPLVLVPHRWDRWPQPHRRACLLHELAHLARCDDAAKLVGELVRVPLFFHPLVLWLLGRLDYERELLCDEAVVKLGADPVSYARLLFDLARLPGRLLPAPGALRAGWLPFLDRGTVAARIQRPLEVDKSRPIRPLSRERLFVLGALFLAACLGAASLRLGADEPPQQPGSRSTRAASAKPEPAAAHPRAIQGVVQDPDSKPIAGATVVVGLLETGRSNHRVLQTDSEGRFSWPPPPGMFSVYVCAHKEGWTASASLA